MKTRPHPDDIQVAINHLEASELQGTPDSDALCRVRLWLIASQERADARESGCTVKYLRHIRAEEARSQ